MNLLLFVPGPANGAANTPPKKKREREHAATNAAVLFSAVDDSIPLTPRPVVQCRFPGQLAAGTCEIVTLDRDSSQPRRTIARQTARCACKKGQIAGTTRARPACVDGKTRTGVGDPSLRLGSEEG